MSRTEVVRDYGGRSADTRRDERRRKLLAAARRIWGESGIGQVTVRGVCTAAGLTPRYFYEHFTDREKLIVQVAEDARTEVLDLLVRTSLATPGRLRPKLLAALTALFELLATDRTLHRIVADWATAEPLVQMRNETLDQLTELVLTHGTGLLDIDLPGAADIRRGALFTVGGVSMVLDHWLRDPTESAPDLARQCTNLCLAAINGFGAPDPRS
ncbi:TetR/AcrR family transcriptional regulator [Nocardia asteroides]